MDSKTILIEGPDGAGKSSLARAIFGAVQANRGQYSYIHNGLYPDSETAFAAYYSQQREVLEIHALARALGKEHIQVQDRGAISEYIYGMAMRGYSCKPALDEFMEEFAMCENNYLVICLPPLSVCKANWSVRAKKKDEYIENENRFEQVHRLYREYAMELVDSSIFGYRLIVTDYQTNRDGLVINWSIS